MKTIPKPQPENKSHEGSQQTSLPTLGIHADFVSPPPLQKARLSAVNRRFTLQGIARSLLPDFRIQNCIRVPNSSAVQLYHHAAYQSASYGGLQTCGSSHVCSYCGAKIGERRAQEINIAATNWLEKQRSVLMATFTLRHNSTESLEQLLIMLNKAYRRMRSGVAWQRVEKRMHLVGSITSREFTYGAYGWHPHLHALLFLDYVPCRQDVIDLQIWLRRRWGAALNQIGGSASWDHGVQVQMSEDASAAEYVSKAGRAWSIGDELAKSNSKLGRRGGSTVPQLLWAAGHGDVNAGKLFTEFAIATKGTSALRWTPGLRKRCGLQVEKSDEEVAGELVAGGRLLVQFDRDQWHVILAHDGRAEVLLSAAGGDVESIQACIAHFGIYLEGWQIEDLSESD